VFLAEDGEAVEHQLRKVGERDVVAAVDALVDELREDIGEEGVDRSGGGEIPRRCRGQRNAGGVHNARSWSGIERRIGLALSV
jgi:hypothetical protein